MLVKLHETHTNTTSVPKADCPVQCASHYGGKCREKILKRKKKKKPCN